LEELNSVVQSRLYERDEQIEIATQQICQLNDGIKQQEDESNLLRRSLEGKR